jgi:hypothetical protein
MHMQSTHRRKAAAILLLVGMAVFTAVSSHSHESNSSRACQVCHVAHLPALESVALVPDPEVAVLGWREQIAGGSFHSDFFSDNSQSRAPPAA